MTLKSIAHGAREVFLTIGALLGVLCIVATIAGIAFGIKPLVFRSGSMSPAIHTGDLAVSRTVDASALKIGDIVSVINSEGSRVTHRVVNIASQGNARQLTLKGDDNDVADAQVYTVTKAERVLFDIPKAGYVVDAATSPVGLFVLGAYVTGMLLILFRRRGPDDDDADRKTKRQKGGARKAGRPGTRNAARSVAVVSLAGTLAVAAPAVAAPWTNPVTTTGSAFTALTVLSPTGAVACTNGTFASGTINLSWTAVGDPVNTGQRYKVVVINDNSVFNPNEIFFTTVVATGAFTLHRDQLVLPALYSGNPSVRIYGSLPNGGWETTSYITRTIRIDWGSASIRCS